MTHRQAAKAILFTAGFMVGCVIGLGVILSPVVTFFSIGVLTVALAVGWAFAEVIDGGD